MSKSLEKFLITELTSIKEAMRVMDNNSKRIAFVVDEKQRLLGTVTDGDVRRWVLSNGKVSSGVKEIYNNKPRVFGENYDLEDVKKAMLKEKIDCYPVIDANRNIVDVLVWDAVFNGAKKRHQRKLNVPVVVMAGGSGTRLAPFTEILPKPLIPIKGKPIIEIIIGKLREFGVKKFYISLNYKSKIIKAYFEEIEPKYQIEYLIERKPLGTAGCLTKLLNTVHSDVLVTNCDIIIDCDYSELVKFHQENGNDITLVGSMRHFVVPYGICEINDGGELSKLQEKPSFDYLVSTGMYVLSQKALTYIPRNKVFHMTDLIERVRKSGGKVSVFPISEKSWIDVGQWEEYRRSVEELDRV